MDIKQPIRCLLCFFTFIKSSFEVLMYLSSVGVAIVDGLMVEAAINVALSVITGLYIGP